MPVLLGATEVADVRVGAAQASKVYVGTEQVWPPPAAQPGFFLEGVNSTNWDASQPGQCNQRIGRMIMLFPDRNGKPEPPFAVDQEWTLLDDVDAVLATGLIDMVDDTRRPHIVIRWTGINLNPFEGGRIYRLLEGPPP